jgi:ABC-type anion transport system duplicated permease subunit
MNPIPLIIAAVAIIILLFVLKKYGAKNVRKLPARMGASLKRRPKTIIKVDRDTVLEKSWHFFSVLAEIVRTRFSRADQEMLLKIGIELEQAGMEYYHVINLHEIKQQLLAPEAVIGKEKETQVMR